MKRLFFNKALRILLFTNGIILVAGAMLGPIYALFVEKIGGSLFDASLAGGIFALTAGITTFIIGKYSDKMKEGELVVVFGYAMMGVGFLLYTQTNSILFLFAVEVIIGFAEAVYAPVFDALYSKHLNKRRAGRQWGAWEALDYFSAAVGAVAGGFIVVNFGFNTLFVIMAGMSFASAFYIYFLPRRVL